ncbi:MAG: type II toxin-antitoxin system VapC family toxin, partial [Nitrospirae bacterium]|nr:type II toxin-antitoxin system VapC family toxin [Candidatus Manganitrophaceae bacterium]
MSNHTILFPEITRDGTSQAARFLPALSPDSVLVDERSLRDLLSFAREYGKELLYFNAENQAMGDWSAFISDDLDLDALVSFMGDPKTVSSQQREEFSRPHLSLFLSFLSLLQRAQTQLNTLTQRHLDFYYQEVLHMQKKAGVPDRINILLKPQPNVAESKVPAGTAVNAGPDAIGKDRIYQTDEDLIVNQAQIATLSSVFAEKETTGFKEARESKKGTQDERFVQMLEIALGNPLPGDALPQSQILSGVDADVDFTTLTDLALLTDFSESGLKMPLFELRSLMKFKRRRDDSSEEWSEINVYLEMAARQKRGNASFVFEPLDPRNFDANLIAALEGAPDYGGLTEVTTIDHLYTQRDREDVKTFIREQLYFDNQDDFLAMMRLKLKIDKEWDAINQILQEAGRLKRNNSAYLLQPDNSSDFSSNLNEAIGPLASPLIGRFQNIAVYYEALEALERDFYMSTESFSYLMQVGLKDAPSTWDWSKVDEVLLEAYQNKVVSKRQAVLQALRETKGLTALLHLALGEISDTAESNPLGRLSVAITNDEDTAFLEEISLREALGDVSELEWQKLYGIVEIAQRFFDNFVLSTPLKERWINLFPAADASSVSSPGVASDSPRWLTFGGANSEADEKSVPDPILGWAMSSPLFALSEGQRKLTLTFAFDSETFFLESLQALFPETSGSTSESTSSAEGPFQVDISGEKGWITPDRLAISWGSYAELTQTKASDLQAMQLTLSFSAALDAIAVFADAAVPSPWPLLRIKLRQIWDESLNRFVTHYAALRELQLLKT